MPPLPPSRFDPIEARLAKLEKQIEVMDAQIMRMLRMIENDLEFDKILTNKIESSTIDIYDRIARLEVHIFPGLMKSIKSLWNVIGVASGQTYNRLDYRNATKKSPTKG